LLLEFVELEFVLLAEFFVSLSDSLEHVPISPRNKNIRNTKPINGRHPLFSPASVGLPCNGVPPDEEDDDAEEEAPAFINTIGLEVEVVLLASSAALKATSNVSPQCLHFFASTETYSAQKGHFLVLEG
jgi:hypothetical protein